MITSAPSGGTSQGAAAEDRDGGRNAAKGLVTTRVRAANRYSVAGLPPTDVGRAAAAVASITPRRVSTRCRLVAETGWPAEAA